MPVTTPAAGYATAVDKAKTVRDAAGGEWDVKQASIRYLPFPNPSDIEVGNPRRQAALDYYQENYLKRASYLNVTGRTLDGLVGAVFRKPPSADLPSALEYALENADGAGASLEQVGKRIVSELMLAGNVGLMVDYPSVPLGLSAEDVERQGLRARMTVYPIESVINFRAEVRNGLTTLTLVVMKEAEEIPQDIFTTTLRNRYRVLRLEDGLYVQELYDDEGVLLERMEPVANGQRLTEIPFSWMGANSNSYGWQGPLLADIAAVNLAHYRNSADYEESLFIAGQPSLFITSDMSAEQFAQANPSGVNLGSRAGHFLGTNGSATMLQATANGPLREAMQDKLADMLAIGAKLISAKGGTETAEAARIRAAGDASALETLVGNASDGMEAALEWMAAFMGADPTAVNFSLNREFFPETMTAQDVMAFIQLADRGDIAQSDVRDRLRKAGWVSSDRTDAEIDGEVEIQGI